MGVDPGSHTTGFGVIATGPVVRFLGGGIFRTRTGDPLPDLSAFLYSVMRLPQCLPACG